ncbi:MAG: hypothetical protein Q8Q01_04215 [archaeon]|nr:hypothetical protein [archaeon]
MKQMTELDYVSFYAKKLREDNKFFIQQKMLIDSQIKASSSLFKNRFSEKNFKKESRKYLRSIGLL